MAETFMSLSQVMSQLGMTKEQVDVAVKAGLLRQLLDRGTPKFRKTDVDGFKKKRSSDATVAEDRDAPDETSHLDLGAPSKDPSDDPNEITDFSMEINEEGGSKIDLAEVEAEAGADESDQTSVLPIGEDAAAKDSSAEPVLDFAEEDLGLAADQESSDVALETPDGESSADILEVAEEVDGDSSSDAVVAVSDDSDLEKATLSDSDVVTDILEADVEDSDDELDTIDINEVADPGAAKATDDLMTVIEDETAGSSADTAPLAQGVAPGDEAETVSIDAGEAVTADVYPAEETATAEGAEGAEAAEEGAPVAAGYASYAVDEQPCLWANVLLAIAVFVGLLGGFVTLCDAAGAHANPVVKFISETIKEKFPNL